MKGEPGNRGVLQEGRSDECDHGTYGKGPPESVPNAPSPETQLNYSKYWGGLPRAQGRLDMAPPDRAQEAPVTFTTRSLKMRDPDDICTLCVSPLNKTPQSFLFLTCRPSLGNSLGSVFENERSVTPSLGLSVSICERGGAPGVPPISSKTVPPLPPSPFALSGPRVPSNTSASGQDAGVFQTEGHWGQPPTHLHPAEEGLDSLTKESWALRGPACPE